MDTAYRKLHQQTVLLVALSFVLGCNEFMIVGILSNLASDFNVNMTQVGFLVTIFALNLCDLYSNYNSSHKSL